MLMFNRRRVHETSSEAIKDANLATERPLTRPPCPRCLARGQRTARLWEDLACVSLEENADHQ
jgi:hypothetical protein